jgi:superfamily II DNA or RNA helicase
LDKLDTSIILDYKDSEKSFEGQADCVEAMFEHKQGIIHRQPGTGKTQIGLYFIAQVGSRSLVIVHTEDILNQWVERAEEYIPDIEIGVVKAGREEIAQLTIATVQTLNKRNYPVEWWRQFGVTILDECHHAPAKTFDRVIAHSTSRYRFGLSASEKRADKMEPLMEFNFGPVIHKLEFDSPVPVSVEKLKTDFRAGTAITGPPWMRRKRWHSVIKKMANDPRRNMRIAKRVKRHLRDGRSILVLSRRIEQLQNIQACLNSLGCESEILAAKLVSKSERRERVADFRSGKIKCVLATQLADEGLDVPILSCVVLAYPSKHSDLILQQVGRALREHHSKDSAVIVDVVDPNVKVFRSQWHSRRRAYLGWGFAIQKSPSKLVPRRVRKAVFGRLR